MGWGLTIEQDEDGFIQIPDADFFTDESDYEGIPPHMYDAIYEYMETHYRRDIDMARDEGSIELAQETARESFQSAKSSCEGDMELHKEKVKELKDSIKCENAAIKDSKPLIKKTKNEIDDFLLKNDSRIKTIEKEIDNLTTALQAKEAEYEELTKPLMELQDTLESYKQPEQMKRKLQKMLDMEMDWVESL
jgi:chromosome segregation ATPase